MGREELLDLLSGEHLTLHRVERNDAAPRGPPVRSDRLELTEHFTRAQHRGEDLVASAVTSVILTHPVRITKRVSVWSPWMMIDAPGR